MKTPSTPALLALTLALALAAPGARAQVVPSFASLRSAAQLADDGLGESIAVHGEHLIAGTPRTSLAGTLSGSAEVFVRSAAGDWVKQADLVPPASFNWDLHAMGMGVAIGGDFAAIGGALGDRVAIWRRQGSAWISDGVLLDPSSSGADKFGKRLVFAGAQLLVVDDMETAAGGPEAGVVYVYERSPTGIWALAQTLQASDAHIFAHFGRDLDVEGDRAVFGTAHKFSLAGVTDGVAYVFERDAAGLWSEAAKLTDGTGMATKWLGTHVALGGDYVFVCDMLDFVGPGAQGSVSLFQRTPLGTYPLVGKLVSPQPLFTETFAFAVSATPERLFVAAPLTNGENQMGYLFELGATGWVFSARLVEPPYVDAQGLAYRQTPGDSTFDQDELLVSDLYFSLVSSFLYDVKRYDAGDFMSDAPALSLQAGGTQGLFLRPGAAHAGTSYFVLGSLHGTTPGIVLPGGGLVLPLVPDSYLTYLLVDPASNVLAPGHIGQLDANGQAATSIVLPPGSSPGLVGLHADHAFALIGAAGFTFASGAEGLDLLP